MYEEFFNLREKPFNLTPSSRFLYLSEAHKEALSLLKYGVMERKGFVLLTGEVGTGKTTMVRAFLASLDKRAHCISLSNPLLTPQDLYDYLAFSVFKKRMIYKSKAAFILDFENYLKERLRNEEVIILIIDEAQRLSFDLLEEIRLLSNMETAEEKLINIFLVGQPELNRKLSEPRCRPLLQRISIRHHLRPLNLDETVAYLWTRLKVAGAGNGERLFPRSVAKTIHEYSLGYPRMINVLADNALLLGYARGKRNLTPAMVRECYEDMKLGGSPLERQPERAGEGHVKKVVKIGSRRLRRVALVLGFVACIMGVGLSDRGRKTIAAQLATFLPEGVASWVTQLKEGVPYARMGETVTRDSEAVKENIPIMVQAGVEERTDEKVGSVGDEKDPGDAETKNGGRAAVALEREAKPVIDGQTLASVGALIKDQMESSKPTDTDEPLEFATVKPGDTLTALASKHYGRADMATLELLQKYNPEIKDINRIAVGQKVFLPSLRSGEERSTFTVHVASFKAFENAKALYDQFIREGYEVYLMPAHNQQDGRVHRITLGSFNSRSEGDAYASNILQKGIVQYAETIYLDAR